MSFLALKTTTGNSFPCRDCKQLICQVLDKNNANFGHVINSINGVGGNRGLRHECPLRLQAGSVSEKERLNKTWKCNRCLLKYPGIYRSCPNCFKRRCQGCRHIFIGRYDRNCSCPRCKYPYSEGVNTTIYNKEIGKYVKCDPVANPYS